MIEVEVVLALPRAAQAVRLSLAEGTCVAAAAAASEKLRYED